MDDFYKRLYDAKEEHQLEFTKLSSKLLSNRIRFLVDRLDDYSFVEYENLMSTVSGKLSQAQKIDETQKSVKVLRFYQIISQNIGFLEGKPEFMQRIFDSAFLEHITDVKELYMNWKYDTTYEDLMKQVNSQAWTGFYLHLQKELGTGLWRKVNNEAGGFMGFWWGNQSGEKNQFTFRLK